MNSWTNSKERVKINETVEKSLEIEKSDQMEERES